MKLNRCFFPDVRKFVVKDTIFMKLIRCFLPDIRKNVVNDTFFNVWAPACTHHLEPVESFYLSYICHMHVIWHLSSYICHISSIWHEFIFQHNSCCYPFEWIYSIQPSFQYTQWVFTFAVIIFSRVIPC